MTRVKFKNDVKPAQAVKLKSDDDTLVVLLGPAWYAEDQKFGFREGDRVTMNVRRTFIDGEARWIATSVESNGAKVVLVDTNNHPAWDSE